MRDGVCSVCGPTRRVADAQRDERRGNSASRGYGHTWRRLREIVLADQPLCVECLAAGLVVSATDVDHIVAKRLGGTDDLDNLQALCHECHSRKTLRELRPVADSEPNQVVIVCGPPGAGKTTFVRKRKRADDVVIDLDAIVAALSLGDWYEKTPQVLRIGLDVRDFLLERLTRPSGVRCWWLITSEADAEKRRALGMRTKANTVYVLEVSAAECMRRIANDERRSALAAQWQEIVSTWWRNYHRNDGETVVSAEGYGV